MHMKLFFKAKNSDFLSQPSKLVNALTIGSRFDGKWELTKIGFRQSKGGNKD